MDEILDKYIVLNNGVKIPQLGLGTWFIDDAAVGASLEDIANWMMRGTPNRNIETRYLNHLHTVDPDLYHVAMRVGSEVRTYGFMEDLHQQGILCDVKISMI